MRKVSFLRTNNTLPVRKSNPEQVAHLDHESYAWSTELPLLAFFGKVMLWARMAVRYGTLLRYASIFAKKYGTLVRYAFFVMIRVRYVGKVRLFCNDTGTVRWYAVWIKNPRLFAHCEGFLYAMAKNS